MTTPIVTPSPVQPISKGAISALMALSAAEPEGGPGNVPDLDSRLVEDLVGRGYAHQEGGCGLQLTDAGRAAVNRILQAAAGDFPDLAAAKAEQREADAKLLEISADQIRLMAGEVETDEMLTLKAVLSQRARAIRNPAFAGAF